MPADQTDDLVADVLLAVWRRIEDAPSDAVLPWLYRVAHLTASNHWRALRRQRRLREKLDSLGVSPPEPVADQIVAREEVTKALDVLQEMRPADREIIKLSVWEQLSNEEIARVLDLTAEATRQRLHRAKSRLAELYSKHTEASSPAAQEGGAR